VASALHTVEATGFGRFMRESLYAYPVVEAIHIAGLALLFGSIALVDLRLLGLGRRMPIAALARYAVPWSILGFLVAAASGLAMFTAHATEFVTQPVFMLKMGLILAAGVNAALLHAGPLRDLASDDLDPTSRMRLAGALSLVFWLGVITCGRMLAYL
jgi:Family of unknown function (DUF6644)